MSTASSMTSAATMSTQGPTGSGSTAHHTSISSTASAPVAPVLEPPAVFATVAPGIYRCSSSSLTAGLPPAPKEWVPPSSSHSNNGNGNGDGSNGNGNGNGAHDRSSEADEVRSISSSFFAYQPNPLPASSTTAPTLPLETFLSTLRLRTILLLAPERRPPALAAWCQVRHIRLVHLGLGALADEGASVSSNINCSGMDLYGNAASSIMSLERIVKDSLELLLDVSSLPCLVCDATGVSEAGVVVGCLRRMQRRNFASIRLEYRNFAASRSRSSHERFIESFDTDLISLPRADRLPDWFVLQLADDDEEEEEATAAALLLAASA